MHRQIKKMRSLLYIGIGPTAQFTGFDVLMYYFYAIRSYMQDYSWQVRVCYGIVALSILAMLVLIVMFSVQIRKRNKYRTAYKHCENTYGDAFYQILSTPRSLTVAQIESLCDQEEGGFDEYDGMLYAEIICHIRMTMNNILFMPNMQLLCELTGARAALEARLKARKDVVHTLQLLNTLPLSIKEGLLAIYINHSNPQISQLARITYALGSKTEPFLYIQEDIEKPSAMWYRITLHRLMGWRAEQKLPIPSLLMMADHCSNPQMAAFLIEETSYWGTETEKQQIASYFTDQRVTCRVAAVNAVARLAYDDAEDKIIGAYSEQPQIVRRSMLRALLGFHSGKQVGFFVEVYNNTPSHESREVALMCLYSYSEEGRLRFEELSKTANEENQILFNQIRVLQQLKESQRAAGMNAKNISNEKIIGHE